MEKRLKIIPKELYDDKLYEIAKTVLPVIYEKVDLKYMDKDNIYMHTSYTAISFAESFLKEFGYTTQEIEGITPTSTSNHAKVHDEPLMDFDRESNITRLDITQLKKAGDKK